MSFFFNMLSRFVIAFLPKSKCLLILWMQLLSTVILEPPKIKSFTAFTFSSICHEVMGSDVMILVFLMLSYKSTFLFFSFTLIKSLFSFSSFSAIEVILLHIWGCWYFSWQFWFQLVSHPTMAFHMIYSAYKLNKQGDNIQPCLTPFPILNQSVFLCPIQTVASWPTHRFLRKQVTWSCYDGF